MTPTPPQVEQTEREAFEAALASITGRASDLHEFARLMWQASRASMQAQAPEVAALQREVEELRAANERMAEWINGDCFCPCCGNTIACTDGCDFATDCPDAAQRMAEARAVLYGASKAEVPNV